MLIIKQFNRMVSCCVNNQRFSHASGEKIGIKYRCINSAGSVGFCHKQVKCVKIATKEVNKPLKLRDFGVMALAVQQPRRLDCSVYLGGSLMGNPGTRLPPRWFFAILSAGGFLASGIYLGLIRAEDVTTGYMVRAIVYGLLGIIMMWGVLGKR
jgi:hypothetical protein